jgi:hypothetical protein
MPAGGVVIGTDDEVAFYAGKFIRLVKRYVHIDTARLKTYRPSRDVFRQFKPRVLRNNRKFSAFFRRKVLSEPVSPEID